MRWLLEWLWRMHVGRRRGQPQDTGHVQCRCVVIERQHRPDVIAVVRPLTPPRGVNPKLN
jgi:hypothetical protein